MKQIKFGIVVIAALIGIQSVTAQTVDEVVNKYVDALGGKEKLASLKTVRMEATMSANGADIEITITKSQMVGQRLDIAVMGIRMDTRLLRQLQAGVLCLFQGKLLQRQ